MTKFKNYLFSSNIFLVFGFILGCCLALGQAPWGLTIVAVASLLILFFVLSYQNKIRPEKIIFMFGLGYFGLSLHWITAPFLIEGENYSWAAPFAFLALIILCSLVWSLSTYLMLKISFNSSTLTIAFALFFGELLRSYSFTGFPWGLVGYIWVDTSVALVASWFGPLGLTGITLLLTALPFSKRNTLKLAMISIVVFSVVISVTHFKFETSDRLYSNKIVRLVQPNAIQENKWDPIFAPIYFDILLKLSSKRELYDIDLVVWPETAIVPFLEDASEELKEIGANMALKSELILGIRRQKERKVYNSLILVNPKGIVESLYDKSHLVPFGEYIPFLGLLRQFGMISKNNFTNVGFSSGDGPEVFQSNIGLFRPLICYEAIFFQEIYSEARPAFIVNITNDGWLGNWAGPTQHLQQVKMRAIEKGLPIIRSANTGISAIINPYGEVVASIPHGIEGFKDALLPLKVDKTFYSRTGEAINFIFIFIWFLIIFIKGVKSRIDCNRREV